MRLLFWVVAMIAGVALILYARVDLGMSWKDMELVLDEWQKVVLALLGTVVAIAVAFVVGRRLTTDPR